MVNIKEKIKNRESNILLYGLTPPKLSNSQNKIVEITNRRIQRINGVDIDSLVIYDIQDEKSRINIDRPFPFLETVPSFDYANRYLDKLHLSKIIYICVGKYSKDELKSILSKINNNHPIVFVGSPSLHAKVKISLKEAYSLYKKERPGNILGAITIAERHQIKRDEHLRIKKKIEAGSEFFNSQCIYDVEAFKNLLSDYYYMCLENDIEMRPIIMTLTPCGSVKTLEFIKWLGIKVPNWLENDLTHKVDTLQYSLRICKENFLNIYDYCRKKKIPLGCNVESVAINREEVLASFELTNEIKKIMTKKENAI